MFNHANAFNQDVSNWETSNVTEMEKMFGNDGEGLSDTNKGLIHTTFSTNPHWPYDWGKYNNQPPTDILLDNNTIDENEPAAPRLDPSL